MASTREMIHSHHNPSSPRQVAASGATTSTSESDLLVWAGRPTESPLVSTTTTKNNPAQLGPEGRVSKPGRHRTRASRRTPTTLLNTDTANFRAMVQQFTGGPVFFSPPAGPLGLGISPIGRAHMVSGSAHGYGFQLPLGQQAQHRQQPLQYGPISNNNSVNNSSSNDGGFQF